MFETAPERAEMMQTIKTFSTVGTMRVNELMNMTFALIILVNGILLAQLTTN